MRWPLMVLLVVLTLTLLLTPVDAYTGKREEGKEKRKVKDSKVAVLKSLENNLISLFGFSKLPNLKRRDIVIPKAMRELYEQQTGMEVDTTNFMLPGRLTTSANTVRSFTHEESSIDEQFKTNHRFRLYFPLGNSIPKEERLKAAELHLSRVAVADAGECCNTVRILVYDIVLAGISGKRGAVTRLVDTRNVFVGEDTSVRLDVTPAVERWLEDPVNNHGLLVVVSAVESTARTTGEISVGKNNVSNSGGIIVDGKRNNASENFKESVTSKPNVKIMEKHVRLKREAAGMNAKEWKSVEPVMFAFTDDGRSKRKSAEELAKRARRAIRKHKRKERRELCRRHDLYVDFGEVGWNDWIVAPPGYEAYYCAGDCPFPISDHLNSTNHAIVQTLVNSAFPNTAPRACCVPTSLTPISMLYLDEESKVILKTYEDMVVEGCGCR